ncbi:MAG TPA: cytochrome ubiquinol oxidase subunit I [Candidatus Stackebrandtia excrementipullorum]|nr:cytochrome ubiquinol oxidase subunit I [Candidatus Stackebrandtia excrementipullorum]
MDVLDVSRWQFAITTVYHFLFVPLTIGLAFLVAGLQTAWHRTGNDNWLRLTKFFGKLFLINFAMGIVTGIVQEFQFGMNWSAYSTFIGDIFGAPLAIEGLAAFFVESTFLGLWVFGWDKIGKRMHLACIWIAATASAASAYFILVANSFMQWPTGHRINPQTGRVELVDLAALLGNKVAAITFPHTIAACFLTAGAFVTAVAVWHITRGTPSADTFRPAVKLGATTALIASIALIVTGDIQGKIMTDVQPMKMAAAEALYETEQPAPFSVITIGSLDGTEEVFSVKIPGLLSWLGTGDATATVVGINDLQDQYTALYGPGDYRPNIPLVYWSFRAMVGLGMATALTAAAALWMTRRGNTPDLARPVTRLLVITVITAPMLALAASSFGWIFTETGRQPWIVFTLLKTADGVSPAVTLAEVLTSLTVFTLLYAVTAAIEVALLLRYIKTGLSEPDRDMAY